jgi:predicted DNA binding CopG/RHH family protein
METGVLPRYAFPGLYVDVEDEFGQNSFAGRSRNVAITEYAPGMEFYAMKKIYKSAGIDYKSAKPDKQSFFICESCNKYIKNENFDFCQLCKKKIRTREIMAISPDLIYLRDTRKRINEPRDYQEPLLEVYLDVESDKGNKKFDNILLTKYGNIPIFEVVSSIRTSDSRTPVAIEICAKCGRARDKFTETTHKTLGNYKEFCKGGEFEQLGIYHQMPTNVISLRLTDEKLFGIPINEVAPNREIFLTTLKNAIINGAQMIVQAEDGEIDGVVKDDEIILFDNIEGGVGYVDEIFKRFEEIIVKAADIVLGESETFEEECVAGCPKCLWSYRRKRDIPLIDKRTIVPFLKAAQLQIAENTIFQNEERVNTYITKEVRTVHSPAYDFAGVLDLKQIIRSAKKEVKLTSLYVTDSKIPWPDEGGKSWVDILSSIRHGPNNVAVTIIVKEPQSPAHKVALRRLKESGVTVKVYKKEIEQILPAIVHSKLVVVDPQDKENRHAIHTSGNFSPEMWKNHETFDFGTAENWVNGTHQEIINLENESRDLEDADVYVAEGITTISIKPDEISKEIERVSQEIGKVKSTISVMDPYLGNLEKFFEYLTKWLKRDTEIKIVTARVSSKDIEKIKEKYSPLGYKIGVVRYLDKDKKDGRETILHDRYLLLDNKKVIPLGKGINTLVESEFRKAKDNVIIQILEIPSEVKKYSEDFSDFWNPEASDNDTIKNFPKDVFK